MTSSHRGHDMFMTDVLVIGAGLAGERAAIESAANGLNVILLSLVPPRRSHSSAAQGGMQAALGNTAMGKGDSSDIHFLDTVKGSDWGCEQDVARLFAETAPIVMREMAHWGVPWSRVTTDKRIYDGKEIHEDPAKVGLIAARNFGGTAKWRTCYTADGTGHTVLYTMDSMVMKYGITVHDRVEALSLIQDGDTCYGAVVRCLRTGELRVYTAKSTVIATGGYGRLYGASTNAVINEGSGMSVALDTGVVPLGNMEAVQFHPTGIVPSWILITEGARGDGGYLLDKNEYRFMPDYEPNKKELASRDVVARRMMQHIRAGFGVESPYGEHLWLDIRHLGAKHINTNLREIANICRQFNGIDPVTELIPVRPTQHYSMGGIRTNINGQAYGLNNLYALGEAACWDLHGFNRLGGNSLAETVVAGKIIGEKIAEYTKDVSLNVSTRLLDDHLQTQQNRIDRLQQSNGQPGAENVYELKRQMENTLSQNVGIFRTEGPLQDAVTELRELHERAQNIGLRGMGRGADPELGLALRLPGMIRLAICIAKGALERQESRGSHFREDFPKRDDANWLKRTLAYWPEDAAEPELQYETVTITELPPGDRGYGEASATSKSAPKPS
ncbi:fumarate reductase flavoprotein subunit [Alicyclobacillus sp. ALC3]|uniref:fumarate reductase flavoprotein subunit n=1 Tax=Alicyclobacillus sp. ALC3 TaxID=2796143 RepID=UPI002379C67E|nr:fumarate reductase flavoprotein subunit [Alicyclobacillus sp. ALC3]WDL98408.1 fumarate reductase flavoprotein subunit [Alicyclobacillus sp. ALC3]